ncbi:hypothetical protein BHE74_00050253 [Ensete ventricosum]|uniref:Uncharacterized protein n=1 Tax=Ensete ventricosum TaxID=4639 RepID=A0A445M9D0_ENSVE|nr:hypothetical protein BHE74_00050253 [Ensete ventricosum]RZR70852.1 hypothetical protein BHM03_00001937 [Ensete ventricosum]
MVLASVNHKLIYLSRGGTSGVVVGADPRSHVVNPLGSPEFLSRVDGSDYGQHPPYLSDEEFKLVRKLRGILPNSRAIKDMIEVWLIEVGLSPTPRGMARVGGYLPLAEFIGLID